jgi:LasA protease
VGEHWALTGGPHAAWNTGTPLGAVDFAPITGERGCGVSRAWAPASAAGVVVRSENGVLTLDLDGDGKEETGWVLMYLHLADADRAASGTHVQAGDRLGHPSCEGGEATGMHVHLARKYNGEWIPVDGTVPYVLSGWTVHAGKLAYQGNLTRGDQVVTAEPDGSHGSTITR